MWTRESTFLTMVEIFCNLSLISDENRTNLRYSRLGKAEADTIQALISMRRKLVPGQKTDPLTLSKLAELMKRLESNPDIQVTQHIKEAHDTMAMQQTPAKGCPNIEPKGIASGKAQDTKTAGSNRNKIFTLS